jgi:hypothetical protein
MSTQIKTNEIAKYRKMFAMKQKYRCAVCSASIAAGITALDHCHKTGMLRSTLCGTCNRNEGKVKKAMTYMAAKNHKAWEDPVAWLRALADYIEYHKENPSGIIHPTFDVDKGRQKPKKRAKRRKKP